MKTVLAPIDFSSISPRVLDEAIEIARGIGGRLVLLNVVVAPAIVVSRFAQPPGVAGFSLQAEKDAGEKLLALQRQLRDQGVTAHAVHQVGLPGECILEQAERLVADYIVMGSHGHRALYELIVGSTTMRVLKQASCPVIIVPPVTTKPSEAKERVRETHQSVRV